MKIKQQRTYIYTDLNEGNNKYWRIYEHDNGNIITEWGPVGCEKPQTKEFKVGLKDFEKECFKKEKKGYKAAQTLESGTKVISAPTTIVKAETTKTQKLLDYLVKQNIHNILSSTTLTYNNSTGLFSTPLGIVTVEAITEARTLLTKIAKYIEKGNKHTEDQTILNEYFMLIPQKLPRIKNRPSVELAIPDSNAVTQQNNILDSLQASIDMASKSTDSKIINHMAQVKEVEDQNLIKKIKKKYEDTKQGVHTSHRLALKNIYEVQCLSMDAAFNSKGRHVGNIMELWHGTRVSNVLSILAKGLMIPPKNAGFVNGRMFGDGLYFSDQSTKSLNYSYGYWQGGKDNHCFMFLADVAMGKYYVPSGSQYDLPKKGYDSTFAQANKSGVMNNEMIVYNVYQANLKYLVEFEG